ncbi:type II toxin-antitoxin system PemK/MazF family toxin [Methylomagnum sp.]
MVAGGYVPERGDVVWLNFDPQQGQEQAGRRPALVLSDSRYNRLTGRGVFCPITSKVKGYPFEVPVTAGSISGVVAGRSRQEFGLAGATCGIQRRQGRCGGCSSGVGPIADIDGDVMRQGQRPARF